MCWRIPGAAQRHVLGTTIHISNDDSDKNTRDQEWMYRKTSNISRTLVGNKIVDNSDVVGASPVGAAPTTSSFST